MAFSLSNWFKGKPSDSDAESEGSPRSEDQATATAPALPPPPSVRTVTPHSVQSQQAPVSLRDPSARPPISLPASKPLTPGKATAVLPAGRKVSFTPEAIHPPAPLEPEAQAFRPGVPDVTVSLDIGDFLDRLPTNFLQPGSFDRQKKVEFRAAELYSDLAKGRASVPASVIYQHCPEIFSRPVSETEDVEVPLPLQKLVEQMGTTLSTRSDQVQEENVGEIETPFLQVAMEDNARVPTAAGSVVGPVRAQVGLGGVSPFRPSGEPAPDLNGDVASARPARQGAISPITPVKIPVEAVAPPTAATAGPIIPGKRPPSTVRASVAGGKIRLSGPAVVNRMTPVVPKPETPALPPGSGTDPQTHSQRISLPKPPPPPASPSHQVSKKTARIQIPPISLRAGGPNGTPKQGIVPPSPGSFPPVPGVEPLPNFRPGTGKEAPPPISFRTSPPPPTVKPVPHSFAPPRPPAFPPPAFPVAPPSAPAAAAPAPVDDRKIELGLAAILRGLPSSMLGVEPSAVPDDVRISLPFALIEPQLSQGRVSVRREVFLQALPEAHRQVLTNDEQPADIQIPLQEVFQNLPSNALSLRADQVKEETGVYYPTPFSQKADEDAQRFTSSAAMPPPVAPPESEVAAPVVETPEAAAAPAPEIRDEIGSDTVTDLPLESVQTPAPSADLELPTDTLSTPARDIPLDLDGGAVVEPSPAVDTPVEEPVSEIPVEALSTAPVKEVQPEEQPAAEAPAALIDIPLPDTTASAPEPVVGIAEPVVGIAEPAASVSEPAASVVEPVAPAVEDEHLPVLPTLETPLASPEAVVATPFNRTEEATPEPAPLPPLSEPTAALPPLSEPTAALPPLPEPAAVFPPLPEPAIVAESEPLPEPVSEAALPVQPPVVARDSVLQTLFMTEEDLDAKTIVKLVCQLPSVTGCAVMFDDGLRLAGNYPDGNTEGFSAMSAPFFKRAVRFVSELELGGLQTLSLHTENGLLSFFMHDNICVSVHHKGRGFLPGVREKLEIVTRELARMYSTAKPDQSAE